MSAATVQFDFSQRRVLITGGTSGMGEATAIAFVEAGARVVISGRNQERAQPDLEALQKKGWKHRVYCR